MSEGSGSGGGGIGLPGVLTAVFVTLKLTDHIDWSWWWVVSPIWITFSLFIGFIVLMASLAVFFDRP